MKTLTKILTVVAVVALCVCLFTLTAFAETNVYVVEIYAENEAGTPSCTVQGNDAGYKLSNGKIVKGTTTHTAGDDTDTFSEIELQALTYVSSYNALLTGYDHSADATKVTVVGNPPCKYNGKEYYECSCGKHWKDEDCTQPGETTTELAAHESGGHVDEKPATCSEDGHLEYDICKNCGCLFGSSGNEIKNTTIPATGEHVWGEWVVIKDPTNVSPGQKKRICVGTEDAPGCGKVEYEEIPATGITEAPYDLYYVIPIHDTWLRGEEALTFESNLVEKLNAASGPDANYVGVRVGTDSLYENSYDTFDFWSWGKYIKLGDKTMQALYEGKYRLWVYDKRNPDQYTVSCDFWVVDVPTLEPYSTDKHVVNSSKSLRFVASDEIDPDSVKVGSRKLYDASDYFVSNDRKNITLSADFLNNRQTGTYTISARTTDGRTIKTNFYILSTAQASSSPRTGDESQIGLWAAFLLLSGAAVVVLVPKLRKTSVK